MTTQEENKLSTLLTDKISPCLSYHACMQCLLGKLWTGKNASVSEPVELVYKEVSQALEDANKTKVVFKRGRSLATTISLVHYLVFPNNGPPKPRSLTSFEGVLDGDSFPLSRPHWRIVLSLFMSFRRQVVLIAHSQGTIIASDVLWKLWEDVEHNKLPEVSLKSKHPRPL